MNVDQNNAEQNSALPLIAHSANSSNGQEQPLLEHLENVARLAAEHAASFQSAHFAEWLGWWHDAGKIAADVQAYMRNPGNAQRGPDHSSAGMLKAYKTFPRFAFNIAGHHGGLSNYTDLMKRITEKEKQERIVNALQKAEDLLSKYAPVFDPSFLPSFGEVEDIDKAERNIEFWLRMLHSALVDADCLDTEAHFNPEQAAERTQPKPTIPELWERFQTHQQTMLGSVADTPLNRVRREIYDACLAAAELPAGVFSLTVPTGGGKTRSALAFALVHALRHQLRRVIVTLPYTTIIEQNADVYRELLGNDAVLEHHSSVKGVEEPGNEAESERRRRMAAENWDAPLIVTTSVQLLESLFANRNSRLRKLHNIARSVLVLDEVQTLPPSLLKPTLDVLQHLAEGYGVTILLCTATQPAFRSRPDFPGIENITEILPNPTTVYQQLRRVRYTLHLNEPWSWSRIADELCQTEQAMVVLNTVKDALRLMEELRGRDHLFHLSANLCGRHRREVLSAVRERLKKGLPVTLVATQVVEAGVDIDFPRVLRALGPLDSIIQAAGRCNREGRLIEGEVVVFIPEEGSMPPNPYYLGASNTRSLLKRSNPEMLHNPGLPTDYFKELYELTNPDPEGIQELRKDKAYKDVASAYRLITDDRIPVIVSYGEDQERDAIVARIKRDNRLFRSDWRRLQPYLVNLCQKRLQEAINTGICQQVTDDLSCLDSHYYDAVQGVIMQKNFGDFLINY